MIDAADNYTGTLDVESGTSVRLRFLSDQRWYTVLLLRDLFGQWQVVQAWGGRFNQRGRVLPPRPVEDFNAGVVELQAIKKKRVARGYRMCNSESGMV